MPTTTTLIAAQTLTSASASVTFSSIPQTFTDLKLVMSERDNRSGTSVNDVLINFNGSSSNLSDRRLYGNGSATGSDTATTGRIGVGDSATATTNTFGSFEVYIPNYTSSNNKSYSADAVSEDNATLAFAQLTAGLWSITSAITSITITPANSASWIAGSSFYLYGISSDTANQNTSGPYAFGGDIITTDGTYWYHAFLNSGSFTALKNLSNVDYTIVAAGGGSQGAGGGGGAGGVRSSITWTGGSSIGNNLESKLSFTANTTYACVIGAGSATYNYDLDGSYLRGGNSSISGNGFTTITSTGGGGGAGYSGGPAGTGGSGGGGSWTDSSTGSFATGANASPSGQGYAGGNGGTSGTNGAGGGGGGAGAIGGNSNGGSVAGNGGNGIYTALTNALSIGQLSGGNYYVGGGGGGFGTSVQGTGGTGGGGAGVGQSGYGNPGTANTGGGAGGAWDRPGSKGGSGLIILRYAV